MVLNWMWSELCGNLYSHTGTFWDSWIEFKNKLTNQLIMHDDLRDVDKIIQIRLTDLKVLLSNPFPYGVPKKSPKFLVLLKFKLPRYNHKIAHFRRHILPTLKSWNRKLLLLNFLEDFFDLLATAEIKLLEMFSHQQCCYNHCTKNVVFH